ncbi:predicted protein [Phaeodactylum tricornutum CCAP 1055/1]|jgi:hypothetical protein|uniref:Uncharacterized protein n=2 Tax=Phaeodactylum tricornutum TaxID=2850 RepID=B7GC50_PHATC|nr:predicted protein [Phaeodactylum tricornutum CCAP 1055/1]EEC43715.1 predicted protein [Phaeodactylum tricornutum CCAP 1055/1]|eukprot:XP_002184656.1 predicted protein [Phaeodactylum tricornutum CCAP 1055/1]
MFSRIALLTLWVAAALAPTNAFTTVPPLTRVGATALREKRAEDTDQIQFGGERGVSVDQDGKSNVWAIEPKVELETKSSEEKTQGLLVAGGGVLAAAVAAGIILTNLPDPNQF